VLLAAAPADRGAFGRFYDRYEAAVVGYFMRRTRVPEVAADPTVDGHLQNGQRRQAALQKGQICKLRGNAIRGDAT
jgi:hypothetical protein